MITFILNEHQVSTALPPGTLLLDYIRYHQHLKGTKIGCREGDCGACTVLVGEVSNDRMIYRAVTSCLVALGNVVGKHIVSIEGLNSKTLHVAQQAMCDEGGTQCGFCTPGFIVSLAGFCLSEKSSTYANGLAAVNGNICRCTGYKSIERAVAKVAVAMDLRDTTQPIDFAIEQNMVPAYFAGIQQRLQQLEVMDLSIGLEPQARVLAGGTDLYVQQHETMADEALHFLATQKKLQGIRQQDNRCIIGASATVSDIIDCDFFREKIPEISGFIKLVSSTQIRNIATIAGNFVNASPIGDLTIFFLALDAQLILSNGKNTREIPLRKFYKGYKQLDKETEEIIEHIWFEWPGSNSFFNFEKVSKRTHLDIASVNAACCFTVNGNQILSASLSLGGVGPIPLYLAEASAFLTNKTVDEKVVSDTIAIADAAIKPISDARGDAGYKRLLAKQLIKAHFLIRFPWLDESIIMKA